MANMMCPNCLTERADMVRLQSDGSCPKCEYQAVWKCPTCRTWRVYPVTTDENSNPMCQSCLDSHFEQLLASVDAQACKKLFRTLAN